MRWRWIACAAVVLLAGCVYHPSAAQDAAYQKTFVKQLTGYCANVDDQLTGVNPNSQPGKWAQQLRRFASEARSRRLPQTKRQQLDILLTAFTDASRQYQSAQTALRSGNARAAQAAVNRANATMAKANLVAQRYGMPPLKNCPKVVGGQSQARLAWQPGNDSRLAVQQAPAAVLGGRIWVAGGLTGPLQATAETQVYDPTVRTWGPGPALPVALNHAMMVNYRGTLWVIGGFVSQGGNPTATASARVLKLNKAQNGWIEGPPLHHARAAGAAAVVGDKIVVAGGRTGDPGKPVLPTEVYNGTSWHDARAIPTPGDHLAAASDGTYLYAVGGEKLTSSLPLATVQRFNPATSQWTQLTPMPAAAANVGAAVAGGQLITLGGETLGSVFNTVRALNLTTRAWSNLPNMPFARHGMGVAVIGNSLYAVNGAAQLGHKGSTKTMQILTVPQAPPTLVGAWQLRHSSRLAVQQAPAAVLGGRIWVAGGLTGPLQATAETQVYDPTVRTWGPGPALPVALNHAMMVNYRGTLWVIGGFVSQGGNPTATASARVLKLNKAQNGWIEGPPLHHARAAGAAAVVGDKIVVAGGRTGDPGKPVLPTEVYNGTSWHDARAIPTPGDHLAAASDGTYLYAVGGEKLTSSLPLATVQRFNPATSQWTQLTPMPAAAANVGAAVAGGQLITLGGETLGSVFNTVRALNLTTRAWSNLPNMPFARHGMGVAVIGNSLYAVNGAAQLGHKGSTKTMQILIMHS